MSDDDWDEPQKSTKAATVGEDLSLYGIEELTNRVHELENEIKRVKAEIGVRGGQANMAQNLFKSDT